MLNYSRLPEHMQGAMQRYIEHGIEPGGFLKAVLCNDFMGAVGKADHINIRHLVDWAGFLYNTAPASCHGSPAKYEAWVAHKGLSGIKEPESAA